MTMWPMASQWFLTWDRLWWFPSMLFVYISNRIIQINGNWKITLNSVQTQNCCPLYIGSIRTMQSINHLDKPDRNLLLEQITLFSWIEFRWSEFSFISSIVRKPYVHLKIALFQHLNDQLIANADSSFILSSSIVCVSIEKYMDLTNQIEAKHFSNH